MRLEQFTPRFVAQLARPRRRVDDVGEQNCCQHASGCCRAPRLGAGPRGEISDQIGDLHGVVADVINMVWAIQFDERGAGNVRRQEAASLDTDGRVLGSMQHQRWNRN